MGAIISYLFLRRSPALVPVPPRPIEMIEGIFSAVWWTPVGREHDAALVHESAFVGNEAKLLAELREFPHVEQSNPAGVLFWRRQCVRESIRAQIQPDSKKHL